MMYLAPAFSHMPLMLVRWKKPSYFSVDRGVSSEGNSVVSSAAMRAAFFIMPFAAPGWMLFPTISNSADAALKFSYSRLPSSSPSRVCLLYTSDAADDLLCVDLGG